MTLRHDATVDDLIARLSARRADAVATLELLSGCSAQVDANAAALENPQAVRAYLEFFTDFIGRVAADCERIAAELTTEGVRSEQIATLRQWARQCGMEQGRCLLFRDKWINRPLPHERMRSLLNEISVTTRDQLTAFRDLEAIATGLQAFDTAVAPESSLGGKRAVGRRELFTRLFKP